MHAWVASGWFCHHDLKMHLNNIISLTLRFDLPKSFLKETCERDMGTGPVPHHFPFFKTSDFSI